MQTRQRIEEDASAFFSKHRSISSDTGYRLQTALFALTGTCTLVFTLCCVELIRELDADALEIPIDLVSIVRINAMYIEVVIPRSEDIAGGKRHRHGIVLQERLTEACIHLSVGMDDGKPCSRTCL